MNTKEHHNWFLNPLLFLFHTLLGTFVVSEKHTAVHSHLLSVFTLALIQRKIYLEYSHSMNKRKDEANEQFLFLKSGNGNKISVHYLETSVAALRFAGLASCLAYAFKLPVFFNF